MLCLKSPESGENVPCIWSLFDWPALETASREIVAQGPDDRLDVDNDIWYGERPRKTGIYRVKRRVSIVRYFGICEEETARKEANVCNSRKSSGQFFKLAVKWSRLRLRGAFKLVGRLTKKKIRPEAFLNREVVGNLERLVIGK